jgi:hypothetical protein
MKKIEFVETVLPLNIIVTVHRPIAIPLHPLTAPVLNHEMD